MVGAMSLSTWIALALVGPVGFVVGAVVWNVLVLRRRHGGGLPLPPWLITAERPSQALRQLVAKMARSAAADTMAEWSTLSLPLQNEIRRQVHRMAQQAVNDYMGEWGDTIPPKLAPALRREIGRCVAEAFAIHTGRRN